MTNKKKYTTWKEVSKVWQASDRKLSYDTLCARWRVGEDTHDLLFRPPRTKATFGGKTFKEWASIATLMYGIKIPAARISASVRRFQSRNPGMSDVEIMKLVDAGLKRDSAKNPHV